MTQLALGLVLALGACGSNLEASPEKRRPHALVPAAELCVSRGAAAIGATTDDPTTRATVRGSAGDAASLEFVYRGDTDAVRELASGGARRQLGLKLRAANGCNLIYVMWRLDPAPKIDVSVKLNPGGRDHTDCGAGGYTKVKPTKSWKVPVLAAGDKHTLRAAISGDDLTAWIDERVVWRGRLPASARALTGPAGMRSDNLAFELVGLAAAAAEPGPAAPACPATSD